MVKKFKNDYSQTDIRKFIESQQVKKRKHNAAIEKKIIMSFAGQWVEV